MFSFKQIILNSEKSLMLVNMILNLPEVYFAWNVLSFSFRASISLAWFCIWMAGSFSVS